MKEPTITEEIQKWNTSPALRSVYQRWFNLIGRPEGKVLEIGCGLGHYAEYLNSPVGFRQGEPETPEVDYTGIDISKERIERCKGLFKGDFQVADAQDLPFLKETFDHVVCMNTIHHGNTEKMVNEMLRVLKVGGTITILEPYKSFSKKMFCKFFKHHENVEMNLTPNQLKPLLKDIEITTIKRMDMFAYQISGGFSKMGTSFGYKILQKLDNKFIIKPLCWFFMIKGVKK